MQTVIKQDKRNIIRIPLPRKVFLVINYIMLALLFAVCAFPFLHLLSVSLSDNALVHTVHIFPRGLTLDSYRLVMGRQTFWTAFGWTVYRVLLGTPVSLAVMVLMAYPLSIRGKKFRGKKIYVAMCIIAMFFSGGLVPTFQVIVGLGMFNTIWALVLPPAMNVWSMILLLNFFRRVPEDLIEYASIEGAGHIRKLLFIVIPLSIPAIATVTILTVMFHWNSWFDGLIYMSADRLPLQTYIYNMLNQLRDMLRDGQVDPELLARLGDQTLRAAQVFIAIIPILLVYPFAQRFFIKGMMLGSVKE